MKVVVVMVMITFLLSLIEYLACAGLITMV